MSNEPKFFKKQYEKTLKELKAKFRIVMADARMSEIVPGNLPSWNTMDLWATAIMMDEALTLSRLTRVLIMLTSVLAILTGILVYRSL